VEETRGASRRPENQNRRNDMKLRSALLACIAVVALAAAPMFAATLSGKVVAVDENSITVMKDGKSTVYILPSDLEIQSKNQPVTIGQLRGRTVTLTVDDAMHRQAQGQQDAKPQVTHIQIDGDLNVDSDTEVDSD
jgi:hypothetical protein